jgi:hypothetical protein
MINKEELKFILDKGESYFIEFKENLDKSFTKMRFCRKYGYRH